MVLLGTVHWKVLLGTKNGSSMASLQKHPLEPLFLKSVQETKLNTTVFEEKSLSQDRQIDEW